MIKFKNRHSLLVPMPTGIEDVVEDKDVARFVLDRFRAPLEATSGQWVEEFKYVGPIVTGNISYSAKAVRMTREEIDVWDAALGIRAKIEQEEKAGNLRLPVFVPGARTDESNFFDSNFDTRPLVPQGSLGTKVMMASHYLCSNQLAVDTIPYGRDASEFWIKSSTNIFPSFRHFDITCGGGQMFFGVYLVESGKPVLEFDKLSIDDEAYLKPYMVAGAHIVVRLMRGDIDSVLRMEQIGEKVIGIKANLGIEDKRRLFYRPDAETRIAFWQLARLMSYVQPSTNPRNIINPKDRPFYT